MRDELGQLVRVTVSADGMSATLTLDRGLRPEEVDLSTVLAMVRVRVAADVAVERAVSSLLERYKAGGDGPVEGAIAAGVPPTHGVDGRVELIPLEQILGTGASAKKSEESPAEVGADADDAEAHAEGGGASKVDFYKSLIPTIAPGTRVGRVFAPTPGVDGRDVTGAVVPARPAREAALELDDSIRKEAEGWLVAQRGGFLEAALPRLCIRSVLDVRAVDFSTGNVEFAGDVTVRGTVKDLFSVRAEGSVRVGDLVEAATVWAGTDALLVGGMSGRGKGVLSVQRDAQAKYLDNVRADVGRDLLLLREMVNCQALVGGRVTCSRGWIAGGELVAGRRVEVAVLGSANGTATRVALGRLPEQEALLAAAEEALEHLRVRTARNAEQLAPMQAAGTRGGASVAEKLTELRYEQSVLVKRAAALAVRIDQLRASIAQRAECQLIVRRLVHPGVTLYMGSYVADFDHERAGPLRVFAEGTGEPKVTFISSGQTERLGAIARVRRYDGYQGPGLTRLAVPGASRLAQAA